MATAKQIDQDDQSTSQEEEIIIHVTKEMDWLPPRPQMIGCRCLFSICCTAPEVDFDEDDDHAGETHIEVSEEFIHERSFWKNSKVDYDVEEIPDLTMDTDSSESSSGEDPPFCAGGGAKLESKINGTLALQPHGFREASNMLLQFAQILFSLMILETTTTFKGRWRRRPKNVQKTPTSNGAAYSVTR